MATEQRPIDANRLKMRMIAFVTAIKREYLSIEAIVDTIDTEDTVDAVEVVRCRECIHYDNSEGIQWCSMNSKFYPGGTDWHGFPEDGFCSYGERRTDNA